MEATSVRSTTSTYIRRAGESSCQDDTGIHGSVVSSEFPDVDCGEELAPQHVIIDFTPGDQDGELAQAKCCAFWDFIRSHPELEQFKAVPYEEVTEVGDNNELDTVDGSLSTPPVRRGRTAVSMLELAEAKGFMVPAFNTIDKQPHCRAEEFKSWDFPLVLPPPPTKLGTRGCTCSGPCVESMKTEVQETPSTVEVDILCQKMEMWDRNNPKSMDPPGHPPSLSHCIMQRAAVNGTSCNCLPAN